MCQDLYILLYLTKDATNHNDEEKCKFTSVRKTFDACLKYISAYIRCVD